jgi:hypothetical protein
MHFTAGYQHTCKMISASKCSCCECLPSMGMHAKDALAATGLVPAAAAESNMELIGGMVHSATAPFLHGGGSANIQATQEACKLQCQADADCSAGTWISSGVSEGQCWLSSTTLVDPAPCNKPCSSFVKTDIAEGLDANSFSDLKAAAWTALHAEMGTSDMCYSKSGMFDCTSENMLSWRSQQHTSLPKRLECYHTNQCVGFDPEIAGQQYSGGAQTRGTGDFSQGVAGANVCPAGSSKVTQTTLALCKHAAAALGYTYDTENSHNSPSGCLVRSQDRLVLFNSHPTGAGSPDDAPICDNDACYIDCDAQWPHHDISSHDKNVIASECLPGTYWDDSAEACTNCLSATSNAANLLSGFRDHPEVCKDCPYGTWTSGEAGYAQCVSIPTPYPTP